MDMKKLILEFRELQRERNRLKLTKSKMSTFTHVKFQRGVSPIVWDVTIKVHQGVAILFSGNNLQYFLEDRNISTYDADLEHEAALLLILDNGLEGITLEFPNQEQKDNFIVILNQFLGLSNPNSPNSDSGRSTLP